MHLQNVKISPEKFPVQDQYPFNLEFLHNIETLNFETPVTFLIGENGSGKSTLLRAMALKSDIYIWQGIQRTRYDNNPYENDLYKHIELAWSNGKITGSYFGAQHFHNFSKLVDEWSYMDPGLLKYFGGKSLMGQSHGQSILAYFRARYQKKGIYFLDEPETALSPKSQIDFIKLLTEINKSTDTQMIICTHSPLLLACPGADIYEFRNNSINKIPYTDTDYYTIYKAFLDSPDTYLS